MQVLCDFYNMHLGREENVFATDTGRDHLIEFFEQHCPRVVLDSKKGFPDPNFTLNQYEWQKGENWFESEDYLGFLQYWLNIVSIVEGILEKQIKLALFHQLRDQERDYVWEPKLVPPVGVEFNHKDLKDPDFKIPIWAGGWRVMDYYDHDLKRFGIGIGNILFRVNQNLLKAIDDPELIEQCCAGPTKRKRSCQRIFYHKKRSGPKQRWCSSRCKRRMHEHDARGREKAEDRSYFGRIKGSNKVK